MLLVISRDELISRGKNKQDKFELQKHVMYWENLMRERMIFSTNVAKTTGYPHTKELIWIFPYATHKINSIWVIDLNLRAKTINVLEDKHRRKSSWPWVMQSLLDNTKIKKKKQRKTDILDCIKVKSFRTSKNTIKKVKRHHRMR